MSFCCPIHGYYAPVPGATVALCPSCRIDPRGPVAINAWPAQTRIQVCYMDPESLCPDLLSLDYIGPADYLRGRVVRAFFRLMRLWPKPGASRKNEGRSVGAPDPLDQGGQVLDHATD